MDNKILVHTILWQLWQNKIFIFNLAIFFNDCLLDPIKSFVVFMFLYFISVQNPYRYNTTNIRIGIFVGFLKLWHCCLAWNTKLRQETWKTLTVTIKAMKLLWWKRQDDIFHCAHITTEYNTWSKFRVGLPVIPKKNCPSPLQQFIFWHWTINPASAWSRFTTWGEGSLELGLKILYFPKKATKMTRWQTTVGKKENEQNMK